MKVMTVDDSKTIRMILAKILHEMGIPPEDVDEADCAEAAHYIAVRKKLDLILLDWNMPRISGLEFLKTLRSLPQTAKVAVMMVTTEGERDKILQASSLGIDDFVVKPFTKDVMVKKITDLCRKRGIFLESPGTPAAPAAAPAAVEPAAAAPDVDGATAPAPPLLRALIPCPVRAADGVPGFRPQAGRNRKQPALS